MRAIVFLAVLAALVPTAAGQTKAKAKPKAGKPTAPAVPEFPRNRALEVGDVGKLNFRGAKVVQVVDEQNVLLQLQWVSTAVRSVPRGGGAAAPEAVLNEHDEVVWAEITTKGMVDGRGWTSETVFEVTGTKSYETPLGKKTVLLLRPHVAKGK